MLYFHKQSSIDTTGGLGLNDLDQQRKAGDIPSLQCLRGRRQSLVAIEHLKCG